MAYLIIIFAFLSLFYSVLANPTTVTTDERNFIERSKLIRSVGFRDREIDRLHAMIAREIKEIKSYVDKRYISDIARYYYYEPENEKKYFFKDKDGSYFELDLGFGTTFSDYPNTALYKNKSFCLYIRRRTNTKKDYFTVQKRANSINDIYVKEVRRIINPTPNFPGPPKLEGEKVDGIRKIQEDSIVDAGIDADDNNDIVVEYYTSHDENAIWPDEQAILNTTPKLTYKLNEPEKLIPIVVQREIINKYKQELHKLRNKLEQEKNSIELSFRSFTKKLLPTD